MTYDSQKHHRRSIRLKGFDYSKAGAYFITVVVQDRACLFGEVVGPQMHLNDAGRMVLAEWNTLADRFPTVELDTFGVLPNHIHGIIAISTDLNDATVAVETGATTRVAPTPDPTEQTIESPPTLGDIVGAFKSLTTDLYIHGVKQSGWPPFRGRLWQRNYHEHVIRDDQSLNRIRQYILDNPVNWASDPENPQAIPQV